MKYNELLTEEAVDSSWIEDLTYDEDEGGVWMTVRSNNGPYFIPLSHEVYEQWLQAISKGEFWWSDVKPYLS